MRITVSNIRKSYGKQDILNGISFEAQSGQCVCITGRNGCGKTTLLSILSGIDKADSGEVVIEPQGGTIGYLPQVNPLLENVSVSANLKLWCQDKRNREYLIDRFELKNMLKKKVSQLSGGMKRRLSLACAMAGSPSILIMDEPTAALDIEYKKLIHDEMLKFVQSGGIIIMVSHEKEEIDMSTRCFVMQNGVFVAN